jgi:HAD superfamily hydrolase (TIGR01509 family)
MIELILFDLDGVLIDTKMIHYESLNMAIARVAGEQYTISLAEHLSQFDGLKTYDKLELLTQRKNLPVEFYQSIWDAKQELTVAALDKLSVDQKLIDIIDYLKNKQCLIGCCSNSIKDTVVTALTKLGVISKFDVILSNEDVDSSKPHPEIYWQAMMQTKKLPEQTLIVEDSPVGLLAAHRSSAHVLRVNNPQDLTVSKLNKFIEHKIRVEIPKWQGENMNVLIPMAGAGSRFEAAGYTFPKPLIEVNGKPMIQVVVENLNINANYIYVVQKSHRHKYNLDSLLNLLTPNCAIVEVDGLTEGAACTTLLAKRYIDNDQPLLLANSDQYIEWNSNEFLYKMNEQQVDAGILTFTATHPKWSFAQIDEFGWVTEVAEKNPISNLATAGVYYWAHGSDYVKYAEQMIAKNVRVNNEFYVCPVFNQAIADHKKIKTFSIEKMWGLGTPEDLEYFLKNYEYNN